MMPTLTAMPGSFLDRISELQYLWGSPIALLLTAFQVWMLIDAVRQREWVWAAFIFLGWGLGAFWYYFSVYRGRASTLRGFEFPGAQNRRRIRELQAQIHYLDNAHHHSQLGDVYFQRGNLDKAVACYHAALERDPLDIDTRAHLGQALLRQGKPEEALPLLQGVVDENPKHDYGYSMMSLAETLTALKQPQTALTLWQQVTANHSYARAKVQLAELYFANQQTELARTEVREVLADDLHAPGYQRKRDRVWVRRAKGLLRKL
jgi:tetratricopeptide (TPR) repeat protein